MKHDARVGWVGLVVTRLASCHGPSGSKWSRAMRQGRCATARCMAFDNRGVGHLIVRLRKTFDRGKIIKSHPAKGDRQGKGATPWSHLGNETMPKNMRKRTLTFTCMCAASGAAWTQGNGMHEHACTWNMGLNLWPELYPAYSAFARLLCNPLCHWRPGSCSTSGGACSCGSTTAGAAAWRVAAGGARSHITPAIASCVANNVPITRSRPLLPAASKAPARRRAPWMNAPELTRASFSSMPELRPRSRKPAPAVATAQPNSGIGPAAAAATPPCRPHSATIVPHASANQGPHTRGSAVVGRRSGGFRSMTPKSSVVSSILQRPFAVPDGRFAASRRRCCQEARPRALLHALCDSARRWSGQDCTKLHVHVKCKWKRCNVLGCSQLGCAMHHTVPCT